ncbi:hypothetical protein [Lacticaseibacillus paracasei]|uniref:hypothetical protein n=1 Tax=Lacticaseibacillus paracasei TaxID=1597 RepID=UPI001C45FB9A|nr:hypothetical protein [Lacticaseibacillus paracasei]QXJ68158.1 hypothetical protein J5Y16_00810 [Lacticaseibacillus paracasei subsp. paracasei]
MTWIFLYSAYLVLTNIYNLIFPILQKLDPGTLSSWVSCIFSGLALLGIVFQVHMSGKNTQNQIAYQLNQNIHRARPMFAISGASEDDPYNVFVCSTDCTQELDGKSRPNLFEQSTRPLLLMNISSATAMNLHIEATNLRHKKSQYFYLPALDSQQTLLICADLFKKIGYGEFNISEITIICETSYDELVVYKWCSGPNKFIFETNTVPQHKSYGKTQKEYKTIRNKYDKMLSNPSFFWKYTK